ncbi:MAG: ABC transporter permease [Anaerolineales bacterium]|nr:ABC transporter permease [Anaerolineales bacterium]MCB0005910.1 ABC transporter permease [Anaerolineales bacterium]MCB0014276.1 ABC transporter permease [Anaerolineales bacterium]MCB0021075.1 ABC transporter permease [Anaerolineales bacterium]MCB0029061.1 ABC transporter permease [Anaerolineales bacterium]
MNDDLTLLAIIVGIGHSGIRLATPYLYAAIGETFSQRSGVLNLGVEGVMLLGAFTGFYTVFQTESLILGVIVAALVGALMGLVMAFASVTLQAEQGISGIGVYLFGLGASSLLFKVLMGTVEGVRGFPELHFCLSGSGPETGTCLSEIPVLGEIFLGHNIMVYIAFALVPVAWYVLNRTVWGLNIRAVGQNPQAADTLGINVNRVRYATVIFGGLMAGVAGASLSISLLNIFQEGMTNGQGFIAVALVYFGSWTPLGVLAGALLFSLVNALQLWVQVLGLNIPSDVAVMMPYLLTIIVLAAPFRRALQPAALTQPFERGEN